MRMNVSPNKLLRPSEALGENKRNLKEGLSAMVSQRVGNDLVNKHQQKEAEGDGITNFKSIEAKNAVIHPINASLTKFPRNLDQVKFSGS